MALSNQDYLRVLDSLARKPSTSLDEEEDAIAVATPEPIVDPMKRVIDALSQKQYERSPASEGVPEGVNITIGGQPQESTTNRVTKEEFSTKPALAEFQKREQDLQQQIEAARQEEQQYLTEQERLAAEQTKRLSGLDVAAGPSEEEKQKVSDIISSYRPLLEEKAQIPEGLTPLQQAIVTFGPALAGLIAGKISKEPGMAAGGLAAGAGAGVKAVEAAQEQRMKLYEKDIERIKERNKALTDLAEKEISETTGPGKEARKAQIQAKVQLNIKELDAVQDALALAKKENPYSKKVAALEKELLQLKDESNKLVGKVGKITTVKEEKKPLPKPSKEEKPKKLTPQQVKEVAAFNASEAQLNRIKKLLQDNKDIIGPVVGSVGGAIPYATRAQNLKANLLAATTAMAKAAEGTRMSDQDWFRAALIAPKISDTPEVALEKVQSALARLKIEKESYLKTAQQVFEVPKSMVSPETKAPGAEPSDAKIRLEQINKRIEQLKAKEAGVKK